ncbi:MAG: oligosaccharide flippase family protein, partial [Aeriscardovia sp.]|nr:oligosaccharide flippase family protein [Aeriscardovia sp.]
MATNNAVVAKNTMVLYIRTLFTMLVSLYTSRVVLRVLGVTDYGIYSAVGGVVAMFGIVSGALSSSISRFITFELGKNNKEKLSAIFATSINILLILSGIILFVCEIIGVWFLNTKMNIPEERLVAANWVFQAAILSFLVSIISIPYSACIIAHEHMTAFAYIGIAEAILRLIIVYLLTIIPADHLITYAILMVSVAIIVRIVNSVYCSRHFAESKYKTVLDKSLYRQMLSFTGWNFFSNGAMVFNTQGVTILVNLFFGVTLNAARGIATQVESAVLSFVTNFTTAINPQIIKSYASGELSQMFSLVCRGAKFTCYMLLMLALPLILEADTILALWLVNVPDYTVLFVRLALIATLFNIVGN